MPAALLALLLATAPPDVSAARPFARRALIPLIVGGVFLAGGATFFCLSVSQTSAAAKLEPAPGDALRSTALNNRVGGVMLMTAGALVMGLAAFLFWFRPSTESAVAIAPLPGGALLSMRWLTW